MSDLIHQSLDDIAKKLKSEKVSKSAPKAKKVVNKKNNKKAAGGGKDNKTTKTNAKAPTANANLTGKKKNTKQGAKEKAAKVKINPQMKTKLANVPILQRLGPRKDTSSGFKVNIKNLSVNVVKKEDVKAIFSKYGPIVSAAIIFDRNNRPTGKAEVVLKNEASAKKAVAELHQVTVDNIPMSVSYTGTVKAPQSQGSAVPKLKKNDILKQASGANFIIKGIPKKTPQQGNGNKTKGKVTTKRRNRAPKNGDGGGMVMDGN